MFDISTECIGMSEHRYELLARRTFGQSSEKLKGAPEQQLLFELPSEPERPAPLAPEQTPPRKHGGGRRPLPPELPRQRIEYTLTEEQRRCSCCREVMQPFGEEVTEQHEFVPASLFVIQHAQIKYACKQCQKKPLTAPGRDLRLGKQTPPFTTNSRLRDRPHQQASTYDRF